MDEKLPVIDCGQKGTHRHYCDEVRQLRQRLLTAEIEAHKTGMTIRLLERRTISQHNQIRAMEKEILSLAAATKET